MRRTLCSIALFTFCSFEVYSQRPTLELIFTAHDSAAWIQLDSLQVMNRSHGGDTILYYPDTVLVLDYIVGIPEKNRNEEGFRVFQNYPNPMVHQTTIDIYVPEKDKVSLTVTDKLGRLVLQSESMLDNGIHSFRFIPGGGNIFFFTAVWKGQSSSIKILRTGIFFDRMPSLEYLGLESSPTDFKAVEEIHSFPFSLGDDLLFVGFSGALQSGIADAPEASRTYTFQYATNIPCPGTPIVEYEGQLYNTIQIFSQCWLKENLNVGERIGGEKNMHDDGRIEKYCYNDSEDNCMLYGGLYQWQEMMQYSDIPGIQGICPPGWHIPTDEEWKLLEGSVDSQFKYGDPEWDMGEIYRGYDADTNLQSTDGWAYGLNGLDLYGFTALPGGIRNVLAPHFINITVVGGWWSSNGWGYVQKWDRGIRAYWGGGVARYHTDKNFGWAVRCLKDEY